MARSNTEIKEARTPYCPFYLKESTARLYCEGATAKPPDSESRQYLVHNYCSDSENHKNCTIYKMLMDYYNRNTWEDSNENSDNP